MQSRVSFERLRLQLQPKSLHIGSIHLSCTRLSESCCSFASSPWQIDDWSANCPTVEASMVTIYESRYSRYQQQQQPKKKMYQFLNETCCNVSTYIIVPLQTKQGHTWENVCHRYRCRCGGGCLLIPCLHLWYHSSHLRQLHAAAGVKLGGRFRGNMKSEFRKVDDMSFWNIVLEAAVRNLKQLKQLKYV